jgi:hypothetical protein
VGIEVYKCRELAWTKLAYTRGFTTPNNDFLDKSSNDLIQKAFIDHMWSISLMDMIIILKNNDSDLFSQSSNNWPDLLNKGKFKHINPVYIETWSFLIATYSAVTFIWQAF